MRNFILLFVNGQEHRVSGDAVFMTLSDFLREQLKLCGTKIVCSEGDCGSCSVLCARLAGNRNDSDVGKYLSIDSCIRFVFQLDGCHVVTVEGLSDNLKLAGQLNGVQQAMVDCHGSQCGYCTPGFVMAMTGILEEKEKPTECEWRRGLTGNLCRCTGYSPIIAAGLQSNRENTPAIGECFGTAKMLNSVADLELNEAAQVSTDGGNSVFCPTTIEEATEFLAAHPEAKIVAGATDLGVQVNKGYCDAKVWLDLNRVAELGEVSVEDKTMVAGARASWTAFEDLTKTLVPEFHQIVSVFGSPQIRHVGTIGGNIINASPIADSLPFLFACGAVLELTSVQGSRTADINDFYQGYKLFDLRPGELLTKVTIPLPDDDDHLRLYKISRRKDLDISSFTAAIRINCGISKAMDSIQSATIALGAVGPVVLRLPKTEEFLLGRRLNLETMQLAGDIAVTEITPIGDVRGGEDYRLQLARNVLLKFFHQVRPEGALA